MTITETAPDAEPVQASPAPSPYEGDLAAVVGTGDHLRIGRLFIGGAMLALVATLVAGLIIDIERVSDTDFDILTSGTVQQVVGFHELGFVLLFALPALLGLAMIVVPLQVGASTLAFGRAAALSFWGWFLGATLWIAGYAVGGGPGGADLRGTDLWLLASIMIIVSLLLATVCVVTTVVGLRTTGMTLRRVPVFSFSMLVAGSVWLLTFPMVIANLLVVYLDHRNAQVFWGASGAISSQLAWVASQPQIYVIAIPVLGIVADQIPVFAGARQRFYDVVFVAIGVFGVLSIGAWAQTSITPTVLVDEPLYVGYGVLAILPVLMVLALGGDTMRSGTVRPAGSLIMGLAAGLLLLAATVAGAVYVIEPLDLLGTTWGTGQFQLVAFGVALGVFSGVWYWAPKAYGRLLVDGAAGALGMLLFLGALLASVPLLVAGLLDQVAVIPPGEVDDPITALNSAAAAGVAVVLLAAIGLVVTMLRGRGAGDTPADPWGGHTLEWAAPSPPPPGNFPEAPVVTDERPLFTEPAEEGTPA